MAFLTLSNLSKTFGETTAVKDFNLDVEKGEFVSFLGPSGCGKTTTLRMIAGFELPTVGSILINGEDVSYQPPNKRKIGMVFQAYALFPNLSVAGNIGFGMQVAKKPAAEIKARVEELLKIIHLDGYGNRFPHQLSGGQQQRVALARALALRPEVLLMDEPLSALDAKIRVTLRAEIRAIQRSLGITAIYVTHDQEEALSISDRVVVMNNARIEQVGTPFEIYNFPQTQFVAQFVGTLNAVNARVSDAKAGILDLEGQKLQADQALEGVSNGDQVMMAIRPERLNFASQEMKANVLEGTIENITFLGSIVRIQVQIGSVLLYMDTFNNPHLELPNIDDKTQVTCSKEAILVLSQAGTR